MSNGDRKAPVWSRLRSIRPASLAVAAAVILFGGAYAIWGGESRTEPLSERVADCLDDYFDSVSLDPGSQGRVGSQAEAGGVNAVDDAGDEVDLGFEDSPKAAQRFATTLHPLRVERVGSVVFAYRGDSEAERQVAARCATGLEGTKSMIERH